MTDQPSYYSIITANVRYDNRLTDSEKLLFAEIIRNGNEIKQRKLYPLTEMIRPINTNDNTPINNSVNTPIITNVKENNTSINNTSNNNINRIDILSGNPTRIPYKEIIDYLNEKTGKKFSHKSKAN